MAWNMRLRRKVQDWEVDQLVELLGFLYGFQAGGTREDFMVWYCPGSKWLFSVSPYYSALIHVDAVSFP